MDQVWFKRCGRVLAVTLLLTISLCLAGCPRKQTILDDRPLEKRPHVETDEPVDRADPFRP